MSHFQKREANVGVHLVLWCNLCSSESGDCNYVVESEVNFSFLFVGGHLWAFLKTVAAGKNICVRGLHFANGHKLKRVARQKISRFINSRFTSKCTGIVCDRQLHISAFSATKCPRCCSQIAR